MISGAGDDDYFRRWFSSAMDPERKSLSRGDLRAALLIGRRNIHPRRGVINRGSGFCRGGHLNPDMRGGLIALIIIVAIIAAGLCIRHVWQG
jgi:hypothetical protein